MRLSLMKLRKRFKRSRKRCKSNWINLMLDLKNKKRKKRKYEVKIKEIKKEYKEKSKAMQEHLDKLDVRLQKADRKEPLKTKTFNDILGETIKANADAIRDFKQGDNLVLEFKEVG